MSSKLFGSIVAGMLLSSPAFADNKAAAKKDEKKDAKAAEAGWCKSNECGGHVKAKDGTAAKNSCKGQMACKGITKEDCETGGNGTWTTEEKPKK
jgi:hypothetical protein